MNWFERLLWRRHLWRQRRHCAAHGHDITGPHLALGGWQVYTCTRCAYRFRADRLRAAEDVFDALPRNACAPTAGER